MYDFMNEKYVCYGEDNATFIRRCEKCCRFVKAPDSVKISDAGGLSKEPHTTCSKCGPTKMMFLGFI